MIGVRGIGGNMLAVCACHCGGSQSLIRNFLHSAGYQDWDRIQIYQGKAKSKELLNRLPNTPEKEMLASLLQNASKWAVIIGYTTIPEPQMRWSDISHNGVRSRVEAELVVETFSNLP